MKVGGVQEVPRAVRRERVASEAELSTTWIAWIVSTLGAQPEIVPSSVANMNRLGPETPFAVTTKSEPLLNTMPVGALGGKLPGGGGIVTTNEFFTPRPSYSVDLPVPLSFTQSKPLGLNATPPG